MKRVPLFVVAVLATLVHACQSGNPPCIVNGYTVPITLHAAFADGKDSDANLPPGSAAFQGIEGRHLMSLDILAGGAARRRYSVATLNQIRARHPVTEELWIVSPQGLRLADFRSVAALRKELPSPRKT
jgi:hypothetical protein